MKGKHAQVRTARRRLQRKGGKGFEMGLLVHVSKCFKKISATRQAPEATAGWLDKQRLHGTTQSHTQRRRRQHRVAECTYTCKFTHSYTQSARTHAPGGSVQHSRIHPNATGDTPRALPPACEGRGCIDTHKRRETSARTSAQGSRPARSSAFPSLRLPAEEGGTGRPRAHGMTCTHTH